MKKYLTRWVVTFEPNKPLTRNNCTYTFVSLVNPIGPNGTIGFERMMVADETWIRENMGNIDLTNMELPEIFTAELKGEKNE